MARTVTGFLDLPAELRTNIYNLVSTTYRINVCLGLEKNKITTSMRVHGLSLQLRSLCKQIRQETQHIVTDAQLFLTAALPGSSYISDEPDTRVHLRALPLPYRVMENVKTLIIRQQIASCSNLRSLLRLLPRLKRIEVDLGNQFSHVQDVKHYFRDRFDTDDELAQIAAGSNLRCEASWRSPSGWNIFVSANVVKARVSRIIDELDEDVVVMARVSIVAYGPHECTQTQPCDCPTTWSQCTVMDLSATLDNRNGLLKQVRCNNAFGAENGQASFMLHNMQSMKALYHKMPLNYGFKRTCIEVD